MHSRPTLSPTCSLPDVADLLSQSSAIEANTVAERPPRPQSYIVQETPQKSYIVAGGQPYQVWERSGSIGTCHMSSPSSRHGWGKRSDRSHLVRDAKILASIENPPMGERQSQASSSISGPSDSPSEYLPTPASSTEVQPYSAPTAFRRECMRSSVGFRSRANRRSGRFGMQASQFSSPIRELPVTFLRISKYDSRLDQFKNEMNRQFHWAKHDIADLVGVNKITLTIHLPDGSRDRIEEVYRRIADLVGVYKTMLRRDLLSTDNQTYRQAMAFLLACDDQLKDLRSPSRDCNTPNDAVDHISQGTSTAQSANSLIPAPLSSLKGKEKAVPDHRPKVSHREE